jgi:predicted nucleic acid-binding protein
VESNSGRQIRLPGDRSGSVILVDTNVVSEPLRPQGDGRAADWLDRQAKRTLYISTISVAEILFGVKSPPVGKPREALVTAFEHEIQRLIAGRIVPFDLAAARAYAALMSGARAKGATISILDGQIAAIATAKGFDVATRDETPFRAGGLKTINPWAE